MTSSKRLLVIDDEPFGRQLARRMLEPEGWQVHEAASTDEAWRRLQDGETDVLLLDVLLAHENGLDFLEAYRAKGGTAPVIVMTSLDEAQTAVRAMKLGAYDFLLKPTPRERLLTTVENAAEHRQLMAENRTLRRQVRQGSFSRTLVGESGAIKELFAEMERVVESDIPVCLLGETGTGKELVARWLHENGPRAKGPFVDVNCAAIPETLIESELFGHERGAFTGAMARHPGKLEQAHGGTLLLDELGEMSQATQARLLRVLQERSLVRIGGTERVPFDMRLVSATQRDLSEAVRCGAFREDLFFRVVVYPMKLPPLRERKEDLPLLVHHFLWRFRQETGKPVEGVTPEALLKLEAHDWPGNVRELENSVYRAVVASRGPFLTAADFPDADAAGTPRFMSRPQPEPARPVPAALSAAPSAPAAQQLVTMEDYERAAIVRALGEAKGNVTMAAERLRVPRSTLYRRLKALNISAG